VQSPDYWAHQALLRLTLKKKLKTRKSLEPNVNLGGLTLGNSTSENQTNAQKA
jgi:hypothetical protein